MQTPGRKGLVPDSAVWCLVTMMPLAQVAPTQARTRRRHYPTPIDVALEPSLLVHAAVHTVAMPIVTNASHVIVAVAAAIRIARSIRAPEVLRGEAVEEKLPRADVRSLLLDRPIQTNQNLTYGGRNERQPGRRHRGECAGAKRDSATLQAARFATGKRSDRRRARRISLTRHEAFVAARSANADSLGDAGCY